MAGKAVKIHVGGISSSTSAGNIKQLLSRTGDVEIAKVDIKYDSITGFHRGFCYVEMIGNPESIDQCISTLNNTKWHGNRLRVSKAKEDYYARLQREWEERKADAQLLSSDISQVPSEKPTKKAAVWEKKVLRIRRRRNEQTIFVDAVPKILCESRKKGRKRNGYPGKKGFVFQATKLTMFDKVEPKSLACILKEAESQKAEDLSEQDKAGNVVSHKESKNKNQVEEFVEVVWGDEKENVICPTPDNQGEQLQEEEDQKGGEEVGVISGNKPKNTTSPIVQEEEIEFFWDDSLIKSKGISGGDSNESSDSATRKGVENSNDINKHTAPFSVDSEKKKRSNQQRLNALQQKAEQRGGKDESVGHIDIDAIGDPKNKIIFNSSEEESCNEDVEISKSKEDPQSQQSLQNQDVKQDNPTTATKGFLWSDSEEDDESETEGDEISKKQSEMEKQFELRPEFEGEKGKKLMELQKRFGGDLRFKLDARFVEDDNYEGKEAKVLNNTESQENKQSIENEQKTNSEDEGKDDIGVKIAEEASNSLSILREMFPSAGRGNLVSELAAAPESTKAPGLNASRAKDQEEPTGPKWGSGLPERYDPTNEDSARFEVKKTGVEDVEKDASTSKQAPDQSQESDEKNTDQTRSITQSSVLKNIFHKKERNMAESEEGKSFKFNLDQDETKPSKAHSFDFFGKDQDGNSTGNEIQTPMSSTSFPEFSIFKDDNNFKEEKVEQSDAKTAEKIGKIENKMNLWINDQDIKAMGMLFVKKKTDEEIEQDWIKDRQRLSKDYKRKHKNATKFIRLNKFKKTVQATTESLS